MDEEAFLSRPTRIVVSRENLARNFHAFQDLSSPAQVIAVVKANAYGHGLVEAARTFLAAGAKRLGVAILEEGVALRRAGITAPIIVFGGIFGDQIHRFIENDLEITASSITKLDAIDAVAKIQNVKAKVHLKIDTGMERIGVHHYSCATFLERALQVKNCEIVGIFSHFANADGPDDTLESTKLQLEYFLESTRTFCERINNRLIRHIANSAGTMRLKESHLDAVRPGISLYGVHPSKACEPYMKLTPALRLESRVVYFKVVKKGAGVSYGHTWQPPSDTRVITLPIGYGDGYFRCFSNRASVLVRGKYAPVRGRICMDQTIVDIGPDGEAFNGDEVILIGNDSIGNSITAESLADIAGTIPYEILTSLSSRIPRIYV